MNKIALFDRIYTKIKRNRWHYLCSIFCRLSLAFGFFMAGFVKIIGERFASGLADLHPMGAYLEALHHTGYYYTFIGIAQVIAAILLLIPRTVLLGALLYFPIIANICILSYALRFEGSIVTAPLMVLGNLYLLAWNYDKLRYILPFGEIPEMSTIQKTKEKETKFPLLFFTSVFLIILLTIAFARVGYRIMPRNSMQDCESQFENSKENTEGIKFCECIHRKGRSLDECLKDFKLAKHKIN